LNPLKIILHHYKPTTRDIPKLSSTNNNSNKNKRVENMAAHKGFKVFFLISTLFSWSTLKPETL
jgi:hypothetical protein